MKVRALAMNGENGYTAEAGSVFDFSDHPEVAVRLIEAGEAEEVREGEEDEVAVDESGKTAARTKSRKTKS